MLNTTFLFIFLIWSFVCFFKILKSGISVSVLALKARSKTKEVNDDEMPVHIKNLFSNMISLLIISGCLTFLVETTLTGKTLLNISIAYVVLYFVIFMHELGHFLFAKRYKISVEEFAIGIGRKFFSVKRKETIFTFRALPVIGYVKPASEKEYKQLKGRERILFSSGGLMINFFFYVIGVIMFAVENGHSITFGFKYAFILLVDLTKNIVQSFDIKWVYSIEGSVSGQTQGLLEASSIFTEFWIGFAAINLLLFMANILPIAPLDGSKIVQETIVKILSILRIPPKIISIVVGVFLAIGLLFIASRALVNNGWEMLDAINGRGIELGLWLALLFSVIGFFAQRRLDKEEP